MNRIILIGNGFDLAHNLKTSYGHFIDWIWEKEKLKLNDKSNWTFYRTRESKNFYASGAISSKQIINSYVFEDDFIYLTVDKIRFEGTTPFSPPSPQENIKNIFLKQINNQKALKNWVDIENEYYKALMTIIDSNFSIRIGGDTFRYASIERLNEYFNQIKVKLEEYLTEVLNNKTVKIIGLENLIYSNFSYADFTQKGKNNLIDIAYQKVLSLKEKDEKQELSISNTSESTLNIYRNIKALVSKEPRIHESLIYSLNTRADFVKLFDKHNERIEISSLLLPENVLFLNFNYTNTENKYSTDVFFANKKDGYKQEFKINQETIHIHGELNEQKKPIIFGYGDELDDDYKLILKKNDNKLLENIKSIKYGETYNYKKLLDFIESDNYQIFVMGHSCGNSDRTLLNTLFEHENCQSIKIFYHKECDEQGAMDDFSDIYRNTTRNFKNFTDLRAKVVDKTNSIPFPQLAKNS
jgi:hypothetical protein